MNPRFLTPYDFLPFTFPYRRLSGVGRYRPASTRPTGWRKNKRTKAKARRQAIKRSRQNA